MRILVVEDEWLIAEDLKGSLVDLGHQVIGPVYGCSEALEALKSQNPDLVFLDTDLRGESCETVLDECRRRNLPIVITTGHAANELPEFCRGLSTLVKPYSNDVIDQTLRDVA